MKMHFIAGYYELTPLEVKGTNFIQNINKIEEYVFMTCKKIVVICFYHCMFYL